MCLNSIGEPNVLNLRNCTKILPFCYYEKKGRLRQLKWLLYLGVTIIISYLLGSEGIGEQWLLLEQMLRYKSRIDSLIQCQI
jgi:hypothetical protein